MAADNFLWFPTAAKGGLLSDKARQPEGESTDEIFGPKGKKALELKSFKFGVEQAETTGSGTGGAG